MNDNLLTIQETAHYLQVHYQTVRNYIKQGDLPTYKVGKNVRIKLSDLENFVSNKNTANNLTEMEIRFLTKRRKEIEKYLINTNAKVIYHGLVIDHWFIPKKIKNIEEKDAWYDSAKGYGVRIREQDNGYTGKVTTSLEIKRLVTPYHHEHCIEQEIDVDTYAETAKLLNLMDFKEFITIHKDRLIYSYKGYKVVIDDIKDFGTGIELEIMTNKTRDEEWPKLQATAKGIGLDIDKELVKNSVTYLAILELAKY